MNINRKSYADLVRDRIQNRMGGARKWYEIVNAADAEQAEIRIFDEIGWFGVTADQFVTELDTITAPKILVRISSLGGDVFDAVAITNALRLHPAFVTTRVEGVAASAASFIAQAGDDRHIVDSGQIFVHEAWGLVVGNAEDMRETADVLDRQTDVIAGIFSARSGRPVAEFRTLMAAETWFTAGEAVEAELADKIVEPVRQEQPEDKTQQRLSEHIDTVVTAVDELTERIGAVVTLRSDEGKAIDDTWRTRSQIDQLTDALTNLTRRFEADPEGQVDEVSTMLQTEYLKFLKTGV